LQFSYSTALDYLLIVLGTTAAVLHGAGFPLLSIVLGGMTSGPHLHFENFHLKTEIIIVKFKNLFSLSTGRKFSLCSWGNSTRE
jgi:hypothetical protein